MNMRYICALLILFQQLPPELRTPVRAAGCQRFPPANSRVVERDAKGCSKANPESHNFHYWYSHPKWPINVIVAKTTKTFTESKRGHKCH